MKLGKLITGFVLSTLLTVGVGVGIGSGNKEAKTAKAADYSSTIRVYVDFDWDSINYVRVGGNSSSNNTVLASSNSKYYQDKGKYVKDISSSSTYEKMGFFFNQGGTSWEYQYDGGYVWIDNAKFQPGYAFRLYNVNWVADGNPKKFSCSVERLGEIKDCVNNATFYLVDGHSWHIHNSVKVHFWGGNATSTWPGSDMTDTSLRLKAFVGDTEYDGLYIFAYTISGTAHHIKFNNGASAESGDLELVDGKVYFFGVDEDTYSPVTSLLTTLNSQLGSYTFNGRTFSNSICKLTQSQAKTFISTYDDLDKNHGSGITSSVEGSGLITYKDPVHSTATTGFVSLLEVRDELARKYPSLGYANNAFFKLLGSTKGGNTILVAVISSVVALSGFAGYFFYKKKKED